MDHNIISKMMYNVILYIDEKNCKSHSFFVC